MPPLRIIYFGTSTFAVPPLARLLDMPERFQVVAVVSTPDKPVGRKAVPTPSPVAAFARERSLALLQFPKLRPPEVAEQLRALDADFFVVAAYGKIIPQALLDIPRLGPVNLHGSLLPAYRGASPIQAAIRDGAAETGVSLMAMDAEMDHGGVYEMRASPIAPADTYATLETKLAALAADMLEADLSRIADGSLAPTEQDHGAATFTTLIDKEDGRIDPTTMTAAQIERLRRAYTPWPGITYAWKRGEDMLQIKLLDVAVIAEPTLATGAHGRTPDGLPALGTADGTLVLRSLQPAGKNAMDGKAFLNGYKNFA